MQTDPTSHSCYTFPGSIQKSWVCLWESALWLHLKNVKSLSELTFREIVQVFFSQNIPISKLDPVFECFSSGVKIYICGSGVWLRQIHLNFTLKYWRVEILNSSQIHPCLLPILTVLWKITLNPTALCLLFLRIISSIWNSLYVWKTNLSSKSIYFQWSQRTVIQTVIQIFSSSNTTETGEKYKRKEKKKRKL